MENFLLIFLLIFIVDVPQDTEVTHFATLFIEILLSRDIAVAM